MLTRRKRKILFWITMVMFVIFCVGAIFYSLGYRVGPYGQIQKTGGIFIVSSRAGARVSVDESKIKNTSILSAEALFKNISPGIHRVRVSKDGFWEWQKLVSVEPEIVHARDVLLMPQTPHVLTHATTSPVDTPSFVLRGHTIFKNISPKPEVLFAGVQKFWELPKSHELLILGEDGIWYRDGKKIASVVSGPEETLLSLLRTKQNIIFDDSENRVIFWDAHTIGTYWFGKESDMPSWQLVRPLLILTIPGHIRNIATYPRHGDYLLLEMGNTIWVLEMDGIGGQNFVPLYRGIEPHIVTKTNSTLTLHDNNQYITVEFP